MKSWETWLSHLSTLAVTVSGLAYLWMKYGMERNDPFSVVNHPWQPAMLSLHVLSAPLLVFAIGLIVQSHIQKKLRSGVSSNRMTGLVSMVSLPLMIVSGYGLQVVTAQWLIQAALVVHIGSSVVFVVTYLVHQVVSFRLKRPRLARAGAFASRQTA